MEISENEDLEIPRANPMQEDEIKAAISNQQQLHQLLRESEQPKEPESFKIDNVYIVLATASITGFAIFFGWKYIKNWFSAPPLPDPQV